MKRKTSEDLLRFQLAGTFAEQNDKRATNNYHGGVRYENALSDTRSCYSRTG